MTERVRVCVDGKCQSVCVDRKRERERREKQATDGIEVWDTSFLSCAEGESLTNGELETFLQEVTKMVLQELLVTEQATPEELMQ